MKRFHKEKKPLKQKKLSSITQFILYLIKAIAEMLSKFAFNQIPKNKKWKIQKIFVKNLIMF